MITVLIVMTCVLMEALMQPPPPPGRHPTTQSAKNNHLRESINPTKENTVYTDIINGRAPTTTSSSNITTNVTYDPNIRPSGTVGENNNVDSNGTLFVNVELDLKQIVSLDEVEQILTTNFYLQVSWGDPRLSWNISKYNNVYYITALASKVSLFFK